MLPLPLSTCCIRAEYNSAFCKICICKGSRDRTYTLEYLIQLLQKHYQAADILQKFWHPVAQLLEGPKLKRVFRTQPSPVAVQTQLTLLGVTKVTATSPHYRLTGFKRAFRKNTYLPVKYGADRQLTPFHFLPFSYCFQLVCLLTVCIVLPLFLLLISFC